MISKMKMVEIIGLKPFFEQALDTVHDVGMLHFEEIPLFGFGNSSSLLHRHHLTDDEEEQKNIYHELIETLEFAMLEMASKDKKTIEESTLVRDLYKKWDSKSAVSVRLKVKTLTSKLRSLVRRRKNIIEDLSTLAFYEVLLAKILPVLKSEHTNDELENLCLVMDKKDKESRRLLESQLNKLTQGQYKLSNINVEKGKLAVLISYSPTFKDDLKDFIRKTGISEISFPRKFANSDLFTSLNKMSEEIPALNTKLKKLNSNLREFHEKEAPELLAILHLCKNKFNKLDLISNFVDTNFVFVMKAWIPAKNLLTLHHQLKETCGNKVVVSEVAPYGNSAPPVCLDNPSFIKPFERLMSLMPLPKYGTVDASMQVAVMFPPIFGLMLGDIGYALLLSIISLTIYIKYKSTAILKDISIILGHCTFYTLLFGIVFGEFFGSLGHKIGLKPLWRERISLTEPDNSKSIFGYLIIALTIGLIHIVLGIILGIINARREKENHKVWDALAKLFGIFGLLFILGGVSAFLPSLFLGIGIAFLLVFTAISVYITLHKPIHGFMLPLELLSSFGNILSYARIMAVGLVSVVLASLANLFGEMVPNAALSAIVVISIHFLNLMLGIFDPTIQGMRLHYVEFFSKFYVTGGKQYVPFKKIGV